MYKVYCDGKILYEPQNKELTIIDPVVELELNTAGSFTFTMPPEHPFYDSIDEMKSYIRVTQINVNGKDEEEVFAGRAYQVTTDMWKRRTVVCEGVLAYLGDTIQRCGEYHDITAGNYLQTLIAYHNNYLPDDEEKHFEVGFSSYSDNLYRYTNMNSTMSEIKEDLVDDLGGYLQVVNEYNSDGSVKKHTLNYCKIDTRDQNNIVDTYGDKCTQYIEFGENLLDFTQDLDLSDLATAILPMGATIEYDDESEKPFTSIDERVTLNNDGHGGKVQDSDYLTIPEAVDKYGLIMQTVTWDDITTCEGLLTKAESWLSSYQYDEMTLECKAVDLHYTDEQFERFRLGDIIRVISKPHGLDRWFPVAKMSINLLTPSNNTITLGTENMDVSLSTRTNEVKQGMEINTNISIPNVLDQAKSAAQSIMNKNSHGVITTVIDEDTGYTSQLWIMTKEAYDLWIQTGSTGNEPVWKWSVDGLAYYGNGIDAEPSIALISAEDGSGKGGIIADSITTGTLWTLSINCKDKIGDTYPVDDLPFQVTSGGELYAVLGTVGGFTLSGNSLTSSGLELYVDSSAEQLSTGYIEEKVIKGLSISGNTYYTDFYTRFGLVDNSKISNNASYYGDDQSLAVGYAQYTSTNALIGGMYLQPYQKGSSETDAYYYMEVLRLGYGGPYNNAQTGHPYFRVDGIYDVPDGDSNSICAWIQTKNTEADDSVSHLVLAPQGRVYQQVMWQSPNAWHSASIVFQHNQYLRSTSSEGTYPGYNLDTWAFRPCTECGYQSATAFQLGNSRYGWERLYMQPADNRNCGIYINDNHSSSYSEREQYFMLGRMYNENDTGGLDAYMVIGGVNQVMHYRTRTRNTSDNTGLAFTLGQLLTNTTSDTADNGYYLAGYTSTNGYFLRSYLIAGHRRTSSEASGSVYPVYVDEKGTLFRGTDTEALSATALSATEQVEELKTQIEALEKQQAEAVEKIEEQEAVIEKLEAQAGIKLDL